MYMYVYVIIIIIIAVAIIIIKQLSAAVFLNSNSQELLAIFISSLQYV